MTEQQEQPLMSSQTSIDLGPPRGDSNKRALKVAGITVLACALIAGQALTAYFLLTQKSQINALEDNANSLKNQLNHRQSSQVATIDMNVPMNSISLMTDEAIEDSKDEPSPPKSCIQQYVEAGPGKFRPQCDDQGNFLPMQCDTNMEKDIEVCWCVDTNGWVIPGTTTPGKAKCVGSGRAMARIASMASMMHKTDE